MLLILFHILVLFALISISLSLSSLLLSQKRSDGRVDYYFVYQQCKFVYDTSTEQFRKLEYPVHETYGYYAEAKGLQTEEELTAASEKGYGPNRRAYSSLFFFLLLLYSIL